MQYAHYKSFNSSNIIDYFFELKISKNVLPLESKVLPEGKHSMAYTYKGLHKLTVGNKKYKGTGLVISGQTTKSYMLNVDEETECCGIMFNPTSIYKLTKLNVSQLNDQHIPLKDVSKPLYNVLISFFTQNLTGKEALYTLETEIKKLPLTINNHTKNVDKAISIIHKKDGQISINELLEEIPVSQKTLETKFKEIVGLTPKKYARLYRFNRLMKKYDQNQLKFKDLVNMYNFHDVSHFSKEFKYFMNESPKSYFKNESEFIKKYLK